MHASQGRKVLTDLLKSRIHDTAPSVVNTVGNRINSIMGEAEPSQMPSVDRKPCLVVEIGSLPEKA